MQFSYLKFIRLFGPDKGVLHKVGDFSNWFQGTGQRIQLQNVEREGSKDCKDIIYNNFYLLTVDDETSEIFQTPPLMVYNGDSALQKPQMFRAGFSTLYQLDQLNKLLQ